MSLGDDLKEFAAIRDHLLAQALLDSQRKLHVAALEIWQMYRAGLMMKVYRAGRYEFDWAPQIRKYNDFRQVAHARSMLEAIRKLGG